MSESLERARILVAEDFDALRTVMVRILTMEGYEVVGVGTVSGAVALCSSEHFDVLVTDCHLPDGAGNEIARQVVAHSPGVGILFMSGSSEAAVDLEVPGATVRFLQKPVDIHQLELSVRLLLE